MDPRKELSLTITEAMSRSFISLADKMEELIERHPTVTKKELVQLIRQAAVDFLDDSRSER